MITTINSIIYIYIYIYIYITNDIYFLINRCSKDEDLMYNKVAYLKNKTQCTIILILLSVYSPFSDRVGLPLHNMPSQFPSVMDIFFVDLKFCYIRFNTL